MRPAACRTSSAEAGKREPGRWPRAGPPRAGDAGGEEDRRPTAFPRLGSAQGEAAAGDRKRAATAARTHRLPLPSTHARTRRRRLPPPLAGFLPLPSPGSSGGLQHARLRRASAPAPAAAATHRPSQSELAVSKPLARQLRRNLRFLQLRSSCSRLLSVRPQLQRPAPAPPSAQPRGSRPRAPTNQLPRLRPSPLAPGPPRSREAGGAELRPGGPFLSPRSPAAPLAFRLRRGDARPAGTRAASAVERSGSAPSGTRLCPPAAEPAAGRLPHRRQLGWGRSRTSSDLEAACVLRASSNKPRPLSCPQPQPSGCAGRTQILELAKARRPCNSRPRQHSLGSGRKNHATPRGARR